MLPAHQTTVSTRRNVYVGKALTRLQRRWIRYHLPLFLIEFSRYRQTNSNDLNELFCCRRPLTRMVLLLEKYLRI